MKILVHLHLYYHDMLDEMLMYIKNLENYDYDLYVTITEKDSLLNDKILKFNKKSKILFVKNRGFDVAPFLKVLHSVDLRKYDYIIKIHTKNDMKQSDVLYKEKFIFRGSYWRNNLLEFLQSKSNISTAISLLQNSDAGMVSNYKLILKENNQLNDVRYDEIIRSMDLPVKEKYFVAGTMFICKAELFIPLLKIRHMVNDFENYDKASQVNGKFYGTLAHVYERIFGWIIYSQDYKIVPLFKPSIHNLFANFILCKSFLFLKKADQCFKKYIIANFKKL